ncbi:MAG: hypothetical protein N2039_03635 [Gemmataceae bacterium]|nr:hypothetical protein [Gemmataceae bacterium]
MKFAHAALALVVLHLTVYGEPPSQGKRIYVCGHSFHVPIASPLEQIAKLADLKGHITVGRSFIGGSTVTRHWEIPDADSDVKKAIKTGKVDVLTLSPHPRIVPDEAIGKFAELLLASNPKGVVVVQASYLGFDGQQRGAFRNQNRDQTKIEALREATEPFERKLKSQLEELSKKHQEKHGRQVVVLAPVNEAVLRLREKVAKGKVPGIGRQSELFRDDAGHGQAPIAVLAAYCHYAVIYRRSPIGLGVPSELRTYGKDAERLNRVLQEISWEAVKDEPLSGIAAKTK